MTANRQARRPPRRCGLATGIGGGGRRARHEVARRCWPRSDARFTTLAIGPDARRMTPTDADRARPRSALSRCDGAPLTAARRGRSRTCSGGAVRPVAGGGADRRRHAGSDVGRARGRRPDRAGVPRIAVHRIPPARRRPGAAFRAARHPRAAGQRTDQRRYRGARRHRDQSSRPGAPPAGGCPAVRRRNRAAVGTPRGGPEHGSTPTRRIRPATSPGVAPPAPTAGSPCARRRTR